MLLLSEDIDEPDDAVLRDDDETDWLLDVDRLDSDAVLCDDAVEAEMLLRDMDDAVLAVDGVLTELGETLDGVLTDDGDCVEGELWVEAETLDAVL
jgi:hypothetical protein